MISKFSSMKHSITRTSVAESETSNGSGGNIATGIIFLFQIEDVLMSMKTRKLLVKDVLKYTQSAGIPLNRLTKMIKLFQRRDISKTDTNRTYMFIKYIYLSLCSKLLPIMSSPTVSLSEDTANDYI